MENSLPAASVNKILKSALPKGTHFSKEAKQYLTKAGSVFALYISTIASDISEEFQGKRKKPQVQPQHIMQALEEMDFKSISEELIPNNLKRP